MVIWNHILATLCMELDLAPTRAECCAQGGARQEEVRILGIYRKGFAESRVEALLNASLEGWPAQDTCSLDRRTWGPWRTWETILGGK